MKLSPLQIARYQYQPKLPGMLRNGISEICVIMIYEQMRQCRLLRKD